MHCSDGIAIGAIVGTEGAIWASDTISSCYYIKTDIINNNLFGCGNVETLGVGEPNGFYPKNETQLKNTSTYIDWDFDNIWSISSSKNDGYPYLQWQESTLSNISVTGIAISNPSLSLTQGDSAYLTASISPINASSSSVVWATSDSAVAVVTRAGKVTAVGEGTAVITVTSNDGGYTASCTVTVTARTAEEYRINSVAVRDSSGAALSVIPADTCLATVSVTNLVSQGNTMVVLASYTATGQYDGLIYVSVEDLPVGATIKVTIPVNNTTGNIAQLKAFAVASFTNWQPLGMWQRSPRYERRHAANA